MKTEPFKSTFIKRSKMIYTSIKRTGLISLLFILPLLAISQQDDSIYGISFQDIHNSQVAMTQFSGKKIVVSVINAASPDELQLKMLDTLQKKHSTKVKVIAIPISNFGQAVSNDSLIAISTRLNLGYVIAKTDKGKKADGGQQHKLLKWLTHITENTRFDRDVEEAGQMFVISEAGVLFAVMKSKISPTGTSMDRLINQQVPNQ